MGRNFRAARVFQTAKQRLAGGKVATGAPPAQRPVWWETLEAIPPTECVTRPFIARRPRLPGQKVLSPAAARKKLGRELFLPKRLVYEEDELRQTFFRDHPWELARPRVVLELDGKDARYADWGKGVRQPGVPLSGECVVQRQLWLMHNQEGITKEEAYDIARREFYALRQEEEIERRIAQEEARMVGAYFGKSALQVGMELEDEQYERWKAWAAGEMAKTETERSHAIQSFGDESETPEATEQAEAAPIP